ncbi:MAG: CHRD domain-containing protein [Methanoregulaceae archaeon]|nr:CHRD domain-containing protein [Methanoregulaceae archaeon]
MRHYALRIACAVGALVTVSMASAFTWTLSGLMDGSQEVPPNASPGFGSFTGTLDDVTGAITLTGSFSGLLAPAVAAHIHGPALPGVNGPVILPLTVSNATSGTVTGNGVFTPAQVANLLSGLNYVNIHTSTFPGGEIRGQITAVPEPGTLAALGLGAAAFLRRRRAR